VVANPNFLADLPPDDQDPGMDRCEQCGFDPTTVTFEDALAIVGEAPDRWAAAMPTARTTETWSPVAYLWHVVEVLRIGTERFWSFTLDPTAALPEWSADEMAVARSYEAQSVAVGLQSLRAAAPLWVGAALSCPGDVRAAHAELGMAGRDDFVWRHAHEVVHHLMDVGAGAGA
jgi:hypothetical protein